MTKSKNTKRALLASVLSMMLCVAMLIGSTFAWFTDSVEAGSSKIIAGNLKVDLLAKGTLTPANGETPAKFEYKENGTDFASIANVDDALFGADILWEPGQVYVRELQVENKGSLAVEYNIFVPESSILYNTIWEPVDRWNPDTDYENTEKDLTSAIKVAYFNGTLAQLKAALKLDKDSALTRDDVLDALADRLFDSDDFLSGNDAVNGPAIKDNVLAPNETKDFVMIAYWAPEEEIVEFWEGWIESDDDFNMNNGRMTTLPSPVGGYGDLNEDNRLSLEFDIGVIATQAPYESDSFDTNYDTDAYGDLNDGLIFDKDGKYK